MADTWPIHGLPTWDDDLRGYHEKGGQSIYNPVAYGAVGDGTTDDTVAINSAFTAAAAGGVVYFPVGVYKYVASTQLDVPSNVVVRGAGWASVLLISASGANGYVRFASGSTGITVEEMVFRRGNTTASRLLESHGTNSTVRNVQFDGNSTAGTALTCGTASDGLLVTGCYFNAVNGVGFNANVITGLRLIGNRWRAHTGDRPINLNTTNTKFDISDNEILMSASAGDIQSIGVYTASAASTATHGRINNNYIESTSFGVEVVKTSSGDTPAFVSVSGNVIKALAGTYTGISVSGNNCAIVGNTIDCNAITGLYSGIELATVGSACSVVGNTIYGDGSLESGIIIDKVSNTVVSGNTIRGFRDSANCQGIKVYANGTSSASDNAITGNRIIFPVGTAGNLEAGIFLQSGTSTSHVDRTLISGNQIYGNNVTNSRGISLDLGAGTIDKTLVGMNLIANCATSFFQSGDTNTLYSGSIWNITGSLASTNVQSGTTYTLALTDSEKTVEFSAATGVTCTVPPNSSVAFLVGSVIELYQYGAGQVTVAAGSGVTIRSPSGKLKLTGQYSAAVLRKRATDEWVFEGDIAA